MYGYIYMTTNLINGKRYIGKHRSSEFTENYKGSGMLIRRAIDKYGWDNFKIEMIEECNSLEELNEREKYWISYYNATESDEFYNILKGGDGGVASGNKNPFYGKKHSKEAKKRISDSRKNNPYISKIVSDTHADFNGFKNPFYGKKHTEESLKKISDNHADISGNKNPFYGKHHSEKNRKIISEATKNSRWVSNEFETIKIKLSDLDKFISLGYVRGRRKKK